MFSKWPSARRSVTEDQIESDDSVTLRRVFKFFYFFFYIFFILVSSSSWNEFSSPGVIWNEADERVGKRLILTCTISVFTERNPTPRPEKLFTPRGHSHRERPGNITAFSSTLFSFPNRSLRLGPKFISTQETRLVHYTGLRVKNKQL